MVDDGYWFVSKQYIDKTNLNIQGFFCEGQNSKEKMRASHFQIKIDKLSEKCALLERQEGLFFIDILQTYYIYNINNNDKNNNNNKSNINNSIIVIDIIINTV